MRKISYSFERVLAIAVLSVHLSVCLYVCHTGGSVRNGASYLLAAWKALVSGTVKLFHKFEGVTPNEGAK